jgi:hypothetical protein
MVRQYRDYIIAMEFQARIISPTVSPKGGQIPAQYTAKPAE